MRSLVLALSGVTVAALSPVPGQGATLDLDPDDPPTIVSYGTTPGDDSGVLRFPGGFEAASLPAVIVTLDPGVAPPPGGAPLGPSGRSWRFQAADLQAAIDLAAELRGRPGVRSAMPDLVLPRTTTTFDDPSYGSQWYLELLGMPDLYAVSLGDPDIRLAVIDSAINLDHPDLVGAWVEPYDAADDDDDPRPEPGEYCGAPSEEICDDHGTAVSGIMVARANNGESIVGLCPECTLVPIRMLSESPGSLGRDVAAYEHAIAADAAVINNSWGFIQPTPVPLPLADVIRRAATETRGGLGSVVVYAAGNDDREIDAYEMQAMDEVLCVSATTRYGLPTNYTNSGESVDVAAPSATVSLSGDGGLTTNFGGTSAAAPVVSGLAGWILSVDPTLSATEVRQLIIDTAVPSPLVTADADGHHPVYGFGEISAHAILDRLVPPDDPLPEDPGGCGCSSTAPAGPPLGVAALALWMLGRRRR